MQYSIKTVHKIIRIVLFIYVTSITANAQVADSSMNIPTVLVELFSSEGCSSCPLADAFLNDLIRIADSNQAPVYFLDYHVDIWNKSGWVDTFSDTSFSRRQREYMVKTKQMAMFTPMMFVNGEGAIPGNAKKEVGKYINQNMQKSPVTSLRVGAGYIEATNTLVLNYDVKGYADTCSVNFVLAYKNIESKVTAGENAGKTLVHHHTAVLWKEVPINGNKHGTVSIQIPEGIALKNLMLTGFVQHQPTWKIYATDQLMFR